MMDIDKANDTAVQVEWQPLAVGNEQLMVILAKMKPRTGE